MTDIDLINERLIGQTVYFQDESGGTQCGYVDGVTHTRIGGTSDYVTDYTVRGKRHKGGDLYSKRDGAKHVRFCDLAVGDVFSNTFRWKYIKYIKIKEAKVLDIICNATTKNGVEVRRFEPDDRVWL